MSRFFGFSVVVFGFFAAIFSPVVTRAQDERNTTEATPQPGESVNSLKAALPLVNWDARTHGPLIAIAPNKVRGQDGNSGQDDAQNTPDDDAARQPLLAPTDRYGLSADLVARHFQRKLVRLSTMAIYAPSKTILLNTNLKPANPFLGAEMWDKMRRLEATLTPSQWQRLGSAEGLGMGDLTKEQEPLLDDILPEKMTVSRETVKQYDSGYIGGDTVEGSSHTLTSAQRLGVRIHLTRQANYNLVDSRSSPIGIMNPFHSDTIGAQRTTLEGEAGTFAERSSMFGQEVRLQTPNRLKPSDLDLKSPGLSETWVPLTGAKTVGDLLKAAQAKTGLELYADGRLSSLPVYLSTESRLVRASDLLESLCWALTATYRKVGPTPGGDPKDFAYVLTYDRIGLVALHGLINEWSQRGNAMRQANNNRFDETIQKAKPGHYYDYEKTDALSPTPQALLAMKDSERENNKRRADENVSYYVSPTVSITTLTPTQREQMDEGLKQLDKYRKDNPKMENARTDRIGMSVSSGISFVIPGMGEVRDGSSWGMPDEDGDSDNGLGEAESARDAKEMAEQITSLKQGAVEISRAVLCIAPKSADETAPIFAAAHADHIAEIWVSAPDTNAGRLLLAACAAVGKKCGIPVGAQVSLVWMPAPKEKGLGAPDAAMNPREEDRNVYGETGIQWAAHVKQLTDGLKEEDFNEGQPQADGRNLLAPEAPETRQELTERLQQIAAVPGLSSIALHEASGPGHDWTGAPQYESWAGTTFGYTTASRLSFLRQSGYDPIDLKDSNSGYDYRMREAVKLPFFDTDGTENVLQYYEQSPDISKTLDAWHTFGGKTECDLLTGLRAALQKTAPQLVVYLSSPGQDGESVYAATDGGGEWGVSSYRRWESAAAIPYTEPAKASASKTPASGASAPGSGVGSAIKPPSPPVESLYQQLVEADFLASAHESLGEYEAKDLSLKTLPPGNFLALSIRETIKNATQGYSPRATSKAIPSTPQAIFLDCKNVKTEDILLLLKGALRAASSAPPH